MTSEELGYVVERIEHLEKIFDEVQNAFKNDANFFENMMYTHLKNFLNIKIIPLLIDLLI